MPVDTEKLKDSVNIADVIRDHEVELIPNGTEFKGLCPFHTEKTPSFTVVPDKQFFNCFGCGENGDVIHFIERHQSVEFKEAVEHLSRYVGGEVPQIDGNQLPQQNQTQTKKSSVWHQTPDPTNTPAPGILSKRIANKWTDFPVVASWAYRDRQDQLIGYALRIEPEPGKKEIIPFTHQVNTDTGETKWRRQSLDKQRLLYGAEYLDPNPDAQIMMFEGEKATDAARRLFGPMFPHDIIPMTWPGGGKAVKHSDWPLIDGREVIGFPDCDSKRDQNTQEFMSYIDQPGMSAMLKISEFVDNMRIIKVPEPGTIEDGWDIADAESEGWDFERLQQYIRDNISTPSEIIDSCQPQEDEEPPLPDEAPPETDSHDQFDDDSVIPGSKGSDESPFLCLGWDHGAGYYLPRETGQVVSITSASHTKLNLLQLAPVRWWSERFPSSKKGYDVDWEMSADYLIQKSQKAGIFDPDQVRGRGAWWDDGRSVLHHGRRLSVDGQEVSLTDIDSNYVYEAGRSITIGNASPLPTSESVKLSQLCDQLHWEREIFGKLIAGWVYLAPICGALRWRPHIWITGGAGTGKTTVLEDIIKRSIQNCMVYFTGETSEAGIRQTLFRDALPVIYDEFESERKKSADKVQDVLALATQASSETGASIVKGGMGGQADSYKVRSMFCFSSISVTIDQSAAKSRITILSLKKQIKNQASTDKYKQWSADLFDTITPDYSAGLQARAVQNISSIRANAQIFSEAAAIHLGEQRTGDQIGTLLAGAYGLHSNTEISREEAIKWISNQNWDDAVPDSEETDEIACISYLLACHVRLEMNNGGVTRTIGELISMVAYRPGPGNIDEDLIHGVLARNGIRVEPHKDDLSEQPASRRYNVVFANSHRELMKNLNETPWRNSYPRTLLRVSGAEKSKSMKYAGVPARGVSIPLDMLI